MILYKDKAIKKGREYIMIDLYRLLIFLFILILCIYMIKLSIFAKKNWDFSNSTFIMLFIGLAFLSIATFLDVFHLMHNVSIIYNIKRICFTFGGIISVIGLIRWMAATKQFIELIHSLSMKDPMLNIYNRRGIFHVFDQISKKNTEFSLLVCDLNELKHINDTKGHAKGDRYITKTSQILEESLGSNGYIARLGGDEFVIIYTSCDAKQLEENILSVKHQVKQIFMHENTGISIGVSKYPSEGKTLHYLYKLADKRMYEDKIAQKEK